MICPLVAQLVKNLPAVREPCLIPGLGRSPGEGKSYPLQYSGLDGVAESDTTERLSLSLTLLNWPFEDGFSNVMILKDTL